jgi:phage gp29-like protein
MRCTGQRDVASNCAKQLRKGGGRMSAMLTRENARPGTPLAQLGGLPPVRSAEPGANANPPVANTPPAPTPAATPMSLIIRPSARDRWQSSLLATYTPQYIENICRGAMAGNLTSQWLMFDLMEQTWPRLQKNLKELKDAVNDLEWNLQPFALKGQKPTEEAQRRARIIEYILWNMEPDVKKNENDFEDTVFDVLDALGKSIAVLEMDIPPEPVTVDLGAGPESFFGIKATRWVHPRYYGYPNYPVTSDELMLNAKEVRFSNPAVQIPEDDGSQWMPFPPDKFIVSIMKQKSGHPINSGMLRILGFFWGAQNFTWEWFLNYSQIFGQPLRWATYDQNALQETITLVEQLLRDMGSSGYAAFPAGTDLKLLEAMKGGGENPQKVLIDAADTICDLVVLNEAMSSEHGGAGGRAGGTQASATVGKTKRDEKVHAVAGSAAKLLNQQMIKPLCRLNFGDTNQCPYLEASAKQSKNSVAVATKYKTVLGIAGVRVSQEQFYTDNDLVQPGPSDAVFVGAAAQPGQNSPGGPGGGSGSGDLDEGGVTASAHAHHARAHAAGPGPDGILVDNALADATGIAPRWLGAVRPIFDELIAKAKADTVTDADFMAAVEAARKELPGVFDRLDHKALEHVIEQTMAAGVINGVVRGAMQRRKAVAA